MNRKTLIFVFIAILTLCFATMAQAQATRTWVSGVGDDVNPCSRTAPCKTFAGAISKTAAGGEISVLDPGGFGAVTITKAITLNGTGQHGSILSAGASAGIIINAPSPAAVTIRNISIHGAGTGTDGIRILQAKSVNIENVDIQGVLNQGIDINPTLAGLVNVNVQRSSIRNVGSQGIQVLPTAPATVKLTVTDSIINNCGLAGVDIAGANNSGSVVRTTLSNNNPGAQAQQATSTLFLDSCLIVNNATAGITSQAGVVRVHQSTISNNAAAISGAGTVVGFSSNMVVGNTPGGNALSSSSAQQ